MAGTGRSPSLRLLALLALALAGAAATAIALLRTETAGKPLNVVVVMADTLRADHLGLWGYHRDTSPNLDRFFGSQGVIFYNNRAQASCTYPSANSILTSRYPVAFLDQPEKRMGIPEGIRSLPERLSAAGYTTIALSASPIVRKTGTKYNNHGGFDRGFDAFEESCMWREARCLNERLLPLLDQAREPFFLYLHYMDVHDPYRPPGWYRKRFATDEEGRLEFARVGNPNPIADAIHHQRVLPEYDPRDVRYLEDLYDDELVYLDGEFAVLMGELAGRGVLDRTIVVLVADHGEQFLEHGFMKHCHTLFDTDIRTPLALRIPGVEGVREVLAPVQNVDLVPTLLDYLEIPLPEGEVDGRSLRPLIEGEDAGEGASYSYAMQGPRRSVNDRRFKLRYNARRKEFNLHDLERDPEERHDVLADNAEVFLRMQQELLGWESRSAEGKSAQDLVRVGEEVQERLRALGYLH